MIENAEKPVRIQKSWPDGFVVRPEFRQIRKILVDKAREESGAIIIMHGMGGYGKTMLAKALSHDRDVRKILNDNEPLWITLGKEPGNLIGKVEDLIFRLTRERPGYTSIDAAINELESLLDNRKILLVIDDVWDEDDLKPFLEGGTRCARLVTTRYKLTLLGNAHYARIGPMQISNAVKILSAGIDDNKFNSMDKDIMRSLAENLGKYPLLLNLVNKALRPRIDHKESLTLALKAISEHLEKKGVTGFDDVTIKDEEKRNRAVEQTLKMSFDLLNKTELDAYEELALFPAKAWIPLATVRKLWCIVEPLDNHDTEALCLRFAELSLLDCDLNKRTIQLHDILRQYLLEQRIAPERLKNLHNQLLATYSRQDWAELASDEPYLWEHLAEHLIGAGKVDELAETLKNGNYLAAKICNTSVSSIEADTNLAIKGLERSSSRATLLLLKRQIARIGHLFNQCKTLQEIKTLLYSRLSQIPELSSICASFEKDLPKPFLTPWYPFTDIPNNALIRTLKGHQDSVKGCAISPVSYDRLAEEWIVSASNDRTLKVWEAHTGKNQSTLNGHNGPVIDCAISSGGDFFISASEDGTLKVWDMENGNNFFTLPNHSGWVSSCAIHPTGDWIVFGSSNGTLKVWDVETRAELFTLEGHADKINGCVVSPSGKFIASASDDQTLKVWDVETHKACLTLKGHEGAVHNCAFSPDGEQIISASSDATLRVWEAKTGKELPPLIGHTAVVYDCAISPDGKRAISASADGTLKVWDIESRKILLSFGNSRDEVYGCAVNSDGTWALSASSDHTLKMWNIRQTEVESLITIKNKEKITGCATSLSSNIIVSSFSDGTLTVWDTEGKERLALGNGQEAVNSCAVSADGRWAVSASVDSTLTIWNTENGNESLVLTGHADAVNGCAISLDGTWIVSASSDRTLKIWDRANGHLQCTLEGHDEEVRACAISPDGTWIVSASLDRTLKIWDVQHTQGGITASQRPQPLKGHQGMVTDCAVSSDGRWIVSASLDKTLKVWDIKTGTELRTLAGDTGHTNAVNGCAISPNREWIASASTDETLKVWNVENGKCLTTLRVNGALQTCKFLPDGIHLIAGGEQGIYFLKLVW